MFKSLSSFGKFLAIISLNKLYPSPLILELQWWRLGSPPSWWYYSLGSSFNSYLKVWLDTTLFRWSQENCSQSPSSLCQAQEHIFFCRTTYAQFKDVDGHCWLKVLKVCKIIFHTHCLQSLVFHSLWKLFQLEFLHPYSVKIALDNIPLTYYLLSPMVYLYVSY